MKICKITCSFRKHERFIYLKVINDLSGARKLQQMYKCKIVVIFIKEVDIYNLKLSKLLLQKQPLRGVLKICSKFTGEHPCRSCKATLLISHFGMGVLL